MAGRASGARCPRCPPSAVSRKFGTPLPAEWVALEGPPEGACRAIPMTRKRVDPGGHGRVRREPGTLQALSFQDAEPELDLVQPRGVKRQEHEAHPTLLFGHPRPDGRVGMHRQIVGDDDEATARPALPKGLQQLQELLVPATSPDDEGDLPGAHIQAGECRHDAMPPIGLLDPGGNARPQGAAVDIGAFENGSPTITKSDFGVAVSVG